MGVEWYTCKSCEDTYCDAGLYGTCAGCEEHYCNSCHKSNKNKYGTVEDGSKEADYFGSNASKQCEFCSGDVIEDSTLLNFALELLEVSYDELVHRYKGVQK